MTFPHQSPKPKYCEVCAWSKTSTRIGVAHHRRLHRMTQEPITGDPRAVYCCSDCAEEIDQNEILDAELEGE
jgi:hypothetical protein